jgi:hypothetical protein
MMMQYLLLSFLLVLASFHAPTLASPTGLSARAVSRPSSPIIPCKKLEAPAKNDVDKLHNFKFVESIYAGDRLQSRDYHVEYKYESKYSKMVESVTLRATNLAPGNVNVFVMLYTIPIHNPEPYEPDHYVLKDYFWLKKGEACALAEEDIQTASFTWQGAAIYRQV